MSIQPDQQVVRCKSKDTADVRYVICCIICLDYSYSQVIGCEDPLRNDLYCVGWGVKLYSINDYSYS